MAEPNRLAAALSYEQDRPAFGNPNMLEQGRKMRERKQAEQIERSAQNVKSDLLARALMYRYNPETLTGLTDTPGPQTLDEAAGLDPRVDRSTFLPYSKKEGLHVPAVAADLIKLATASNPQYSNLMQPEEAMPLATNMMGGGVVASRLAPAPAGLLGMNVWHGTPHRFPPTAKNPLGEFDASKIGTGEGAQAYGHGLYLAESPKVAGENALQGKESLYKVDLPDEQIAKMLDWDKPLSGQSAEVKAALQAALKADRNAFGGLSGHVKFNSKEVTGSDLYKNLRSGVDAQKEIPGVGYDFGDVGASNILRDLGIPGIRYLYGGSRVGGKGTSNFVVFDPKHMNIIGRESPKAIKDLMPIEYKSAMSIEPPHNVRDNKKLLSLTESMRNTGWQGRPILTYDVGRGNEALTGSHRIKAAREANIEVPIYEIKNVGNYVDANGKSIHDVGFMELDEQVKWLNKFGDKNAAKLLKQEPEFQDVGNTSAPAGSLGMNVVAKRAFTAPQDEVPQFVNTNNLPNQGRDLIRSTADELSTMLNQQGFRTDVKHSGSAAGPSSYVTVYDPQTGRSITDPARISGHSKGAFNSQFAHNISDDPQSMQKFVDLAMEMRAKGPSEMMKQQPVVEQAVIEMRYKNAQKKIAKGKTLTKSEQEAVALKSAPDLLAEEK